DTEEARDTAADVLVLPGTKIDAVEKMLRTVEQCLQAFVALSRYPGYGCLHHFLSSCWPVSPVANASTTANWKPRKPSSLPLRLPRSPGSTSPVPPRECLAHCR